MGLKSGRSHEEELKKKVVAVVAFFLHCLVWTWVFLLVRLSVHFPWVFEILLFSVKFGVQTGIWFFLHSFKKLSGVLETWDAEFG